MKNRIFHLLAALILLVSCIGISAAAHEVPDPDRTGTIEVTLKTAAGETVKGEVTIYRVGDIHEDDGNYSFALTEEFAGSGVTLEYVHSSEKAAALAEYAADSDIEGVAEPIEETGRVLFAVDPALYLLVQTEAKNSEGFNPFLIAVPNMEDGAYVYDVDANPKVGPIPEQTEPSTEPDSDETTPGTDETTPSTPEEEEKLPQTGQLNWPVPLLAAVGTVLFAAGWALRFKDRKEEYEA